MNTENYTDLLGEINALYKKGFERALLEALGGNKGLLTAASLWIATLRSR